jgi:putative endonuclease
MYYVYIIYSNYLNSYYIGYCENNISQRIEKHNQGYYHNAYTKKANDLILFFDISCNTLSQALKIEKHIKKMKSRIYFENLKKYPEIKEKLIQKYAEI